MQTSPRFGRPMAFLVLSLAVSLCRGIVRQIQSTGAIPGDEFQLAGMLYAALPAIDLMTAFGLGLLVLLMLREARAESRVLLRTLSLLTAALAALSFFWPTLAGLAALVLILRQSRSDALALEAVASDDLRRRDAFAAALVQANFRELLLWWVGLAVVAAFGAFIIAFLESFIYTARFAPRLFDPVVLTSYRIRLVDLSFMFGIRLAVGALIPIVVTRMIAQRLSPAGQIRLSTAALSFSITAFSAFAFAFVVGDEIYKTGVALHALGLHVLAYHLWCSRMRSNLRLGSFGLFGGETPLPQTAWMALFSAIFLVPSEALPASWRQKIRGSARLNHAVHALVGFIWLSLFILLSYPELEDFRSRFILLSIVTAVVVFLLAVLSLIFMRRRIRQSTPGGSFIVAVVGVLLFLVFSYFRPIGNDVAIVLCEYSRFGYMLKQASLRELIGDENQVGLVPVAEAFPYHGDSDGTLPTEVPEFYAENRPPIVIVLWDAGRPDRMGLYGHERPTTPNLDRMASEAIVFDRAYSGATATTCGVRHLFTGCYSTRYMLSTEHEPFFIHRLRPLGYKRFLITAFGSDFNGVSLDSFERNAPPAARDGAQFVHLALHPQGLNRERPDTEKTANVMREWRRIAQEEGPEGLDGSLTFLHLTGTHFPWYNKNPVHDFGSKPEDRYDGEVAKVDKLTGEAFDTLRELGVWDRAIVMLVADHGTGLAEHGRYAGFLPYEEQIRIPMLIKAPGFAARRVAEPVATIDIAPTILNLMTPGAENPFDGLSLVELMSGEETQLQRRVLASLCAFEDAYSLIVDRRWKLHFHRRENYALLFDLENDPGELRNLYNSNPEKRQEALDLMAAFLWDGSRRGFGNPYHYSDWTPPER